MIVRSSKSGKVWCYGCDQWIARTQFHKNKARNNGIDSRCKKCAAARRSKMRVSTTARREASNKYQREFNVRRRAAVIHHYSQGTMSCKRCGFSDIRALTIDHINGGGRKDRERTGAGTTFVYWLHKHKFPEGYQILCMNCNFIKRHENEEHGGRRDWKVKKPLKFPTPKGK